MRVKTLTTIACCLAFAASAGAQDFHKIVNQVGQSVESQRGLHCLTAEGDGVSVQRCSGSDNQKWAYQSERLRPKGRPDRCLDMNPAPFPGFHRNISLHPCKTSGENNQKWYQESAFIRTRDWFTCLNWQYDEGGKVNGRSCDGNWPSMKWTMERIVPPPITPAPPVITPPPVSGPPVFRPVEPERTGCTVVFVHGLRSSGGMWYRTIKDGPLHGEQTSLQRVQALGFKVEAINFSNSENLSFNQQADELKTWIAAALERDRTRYAVLVGHSMGGIAALRYAQKYGHERKTAGVITMNSPLLGSPSADLLEAVSATGKTLQVAGAVGCAFGDPGSCIGAAAGFGLDAGANLAGPVGSVAAQSLKPGSAQIAELGRDLSRLEGTGIHVHSIVVGSDEKWIAGGVGGIVSGDGVVPAYHQSVINLKDKYAPNARLSGQITKSHQHPDDWFYSMTYSLEGRQGMAGRTLPEGTHLPHIFHNDAPHSPEVKDNVDNTLASQPFCNKCGVVECNRTIQAIGETDSTTDKRAAPVVFDLKSGADSVATRKSSYEVPVSGLTGKIDAGQLNRFRLHGVCYYPASGAPAGKPEAKPCGNLTPEKIVTDGAGRATRLVFKTPDAFRDPAVYQVQLAALMQTPYKTRDGKDVVIPSTPHIVPLQRTPRIAAPASAAQGDAIEIRLAGFPDNSRFALDLGVEKGARYRVGLASTGAGGSGALRLALPPGLPDDTYVISAEAGGPPASTRIRVAGKRKPPVLTHLLPAKPGKVQVPGYQPGDKVHVRGENWVPFGKFGAALLSAASAGSQVPAATRSFELRNLLDTCKDELSGLPKPGVCDPARGVIEQHWRFDFEVPPGRYRLRLTDGLNEATTQEFEIYPSFYIRVKSPAPVKAGQRIEVEWQGFRPNSSADVFLDDARLTGRSLLLDFADPVVSVRLPDEAAGRRVLRMADAEGNTAQAPIEIAGIGEQAGATGPGKGGKPPEEPGKPDGTKPPTGPNLCNPELPRIWQPGCVEKQDDKRVTTTPTGKPCDPELPRFWQPGCVETPAAGDDRRRGQPVACDPNTPRYAQPGCIETGATPPLRAPVAAPPAQTPVAPPRSEVKPALPATPVVTPAAAAPKAPVIQAPVCDPNRPRYAQPGCVEAAASPPVPAPASPSPAKPAATAPSPASAGSGQPCNPSIPRYAQPGCTP